VTLRWPNDVNRLQKMSLIEEGEHRQVRMANLAIVGSHSINGVSALHSELLKELVIPEFAEMMPEKINNKTNGITPSPLAAGLQSRPVQPDHQSHR
jgi:starch phosphorylase